MTIAKLIESRIVDDVDEAIRMFPIEELDDFALAERKPRSVDYRIRQRPRKSARRTDNIRLGVRA